MSVTNADVRQAAQLARLTLDDARLPGLVAELNGILQHIDALQQVTVPLGSNDLAEPGMPLRSDEVPPVALGHPRESFAPAMREGFFLVPRLATHGEAGATEPERPA
jgi:aspartyl-tRNA(Asn)/glutamyl-tRNA(Gln) amidotransferase subunit C